MKAKKLLGCLLTGILLVWIVSPGCEVLNMKKDLQKLQQENAQLNEEIQRLRGELAESRNKVLELQTKNSELGVQLERSAFHEQEIDRTLKGYKELEIEKSMLQKQVADLEIKLASKQTAIAELEEKLRKKDSPADEMKKALFKVGDCVMWYGSPFKELRTMKGTVVSSKGGLSYVVRCTETSMPYLWAKDALYELEENNLVACE